MADATFPPGSTPPEPAVTRSRVAIVGAGFAGIGMGYYLDQAGEADYVIFEKADAPGGTWRENTYPGAACDVPSHLYSFSFARYHPWRWRYAKQPEILAYQKSVAEAKGVTPRIRFGAKVEAAAFDAARNVWVISLAGGKTHEATFLVTAVGQLHNPSIPKIPGADTFKGPSFHSARWRHDVSLEGKKVAVIGTGASAVQFVPEVSKAAAHLDLYQRSPGWMIPKVEKRFSDTEISLMQKLPLLHDTDRARLFGTVELLGWIYKGHRWAEKILETAAKAHLWRQVKDPVLRKKLTPDFPIGCKRILLSNEWYPTLAKPTTEVVTERVAAITPTGVVTAAGTERPADVLIYGTGFAATDLLVPMQVTGANGEKLQDRWARGAEAYLGMSVPGFPNFFVIYGPNTNLGSGSIIFMLEQQQRYLAELIAAQKKKGWRRVEVKPAVFAGYQKWIERQSANTPYVAGCHNWYTTAEGKNTINWVGLMREYAARTKRVEWADYQTA